MKLKSQTEVSTLTGTPKTFIWAVGAYKYIRNGEVLADFLSEFDEVMDLFDYPIVISNDCDSNMSIKIRDYLLKNKYNNYKRDG